MAKAEDAITRTIARLASGHPVESMEAAKQVVAGKVRLNPDLLIEIAGSDCYSVASRIAATYTLGLLAEKRSAKTLIGILRDASESTRLRDHAAEALGNIREKDAVNVLKEVLSQQANSKLVKSCLYALSEIGTPASRSLLKRFAREKRKNGTKSSRTVKPDQKGTA